MFPIFYYNYEQQFIPHIEDQINIEVDGNDADDEGDEEDEEDEEEEDEEENDDEEKEDCNTIDPDDILPENINLPSEISEEPQQHNQVGEHLDESLDEEINQHMYDENDRELKRRRLDNDTVLETEYISDFLRSCGAESNAPAPAPVPTPVQLDRPSNPVSNIERAESPIIPVFFDIGPSVELPKLNFQKLSELARLPESPTEEKNIQMEEKKDEEKKEKKIQIVHNATHIGCGVSCLLCILKICL
jgi:hypothetical protein